MTATLGKNKMVGIVKKTLSKLQNKKSKQTLARLKKGFNDRGAGWNTVRQQVLYFAKFVINALNKYSSLFKTFFILVHYFPLPSIQYEMNSKNKLHVFDQIFGLKIFCGNLM